MVHRRSRKSMSAPPGLSGCVNNELDNMQLQLSNLQRQVDVLSRVLLFVDIDKLSQTVKLHCIADLDPDEEDASAEYDLEGVFDLSEGDARSLELVQSHPCVHTTSSQTESDFDITALQIRVSECEAEVQRVTCLAEELGDVQSKIDELDARDPLQKLDLIVEAINDNTNAKVGDFTDRLQDVMENLGTLSKSEASILSRLAALEISIGMPCEGVVQDSKKKKRSEKK